MSHIPVPVKVLEYLKCRKGLCEKEIADALKESQESVGKVLNKFVERDVLVKEGGTYKLGPKFELVLEKTLRTYEKVGRKPERGKIIRGFLSLIPRYYLVSLCLLLRIVHEEGFEEEEIEDFLNDEAKRGLVRRIKVLSNRELPSILPYRYYWRMKVFYTHEYGRLKKAWKLRGLEIYERDFLAVRYPAGLINSTKEYLRGKEEFIEKVKRELPDPYLFWLKGHRNYQPTRVHP